MVIHFIFFLTLSLITSLFSVSYYAYNTPVSGVNILGTIIFLGGLSAYSYYHGRKNNKVYLKFIYIYSILFIASGLLSSTSKISMIAILFLNLIPMYPVTHFIQGFMNPSLVIATTVSLELLLIFLCYYFGKHRFVIKNLS